MLSRDPVRSTAQSNNTNGLSGRSSYTSTAASASYAPAMASPRPRPSTLSQGRPSVPASPAPAGVSQWQALGSVLPTAPKAPPKQVSTTAVTSTAPAVKKEAAPDPVQVSPVVKMETTTKTAQPTSGATSAGISDRKKAASWQIKDITNTLKKSTQDALPPHLRAKANPQDPAGKPNESPSSLTTQASAASAFGKQPSVFSKPEPIAKLADPAANSSSGAGSQDQKIKSEEKAVDPVPDLFAKLRVASGSFASPKDSEEQKVKSPGIDSTDRLFAKLKAPIGNSSSGAKSQDQKFTFAGAPTTAKSDPLATPTKPISFLSNGTASQEKDSKPADSLFAAKPSLFSSKNTQSIPATDGGRENRNVLQQSVADPTADATNISKSESNSIVATLQAVKKELETTRKRLEAMETDNLALQKQVEVLVQTDERRKFLGTDNARTPFGVEVQGRKFFLYHINSSSTDLC